MDSGERRSDLESRLDTFLAQRWLVALGITFLSAFLIYSTVRVGQHAPKSGRNDWGVYYGAGAAMWERQPIYTLEQGPLMTFKNAPVVALAAMPMSAMPRPIARMAFILVDFALLALILWMTIRLIGEKSNRLAVWIAAVSPFLLFHYFFAQLYAGQTTLIFLACTIGAFYLGVRGRPWLAGMALGAAICLKLVPICFAPYFLLIPKPAKAVTSTVLSTAALLLLPTVWLGWDANRALLVEWPEHLRDTEIPQQLWRLQNQSVLAQLARLLSPNGYLVNVVDLPLNTVRLIWLGLSLLAAAAVYMFCYRTRADQRARIVHLSLLLTYMTIFNPLGWRYNFLALVVACVLVLSHLAKRPDDRKTLWLFIAAMLLTALPTDLGIYGTRLVGAIILSGAVLTTYVSQRALKIRSNPQPLA